MQKALAEADALIVRPPLQSALNQGDNISLILLD
jgi:hypothetical protein